MDSRIVLALDFDETIAPTYAAIVEPWDAFMAEWLVIHGLFTSTEEARASFTPQNDYGCGPTYFAKKFGQDAPWVEAFYQAVTPVILPPALAHVRPDPLLREQLLALFAKGYVPAIISQGHRDYVLPLLAHLNLADIFPPRLVVDRALKRLSPHGFLELKHLTRHLHVERYIMADDTVANLNTAHACGYHTVHIHPKAPSDQPYVAERHATLTEYLATLLT